MWEVRYCTLMGKRIIYFGIGAVVVIAAVGGAVIYKRSVRDATTTYNAEPLVLRKDVGMTEVQKKVFLDRIADAEKQLGTFEVSDGTKVDRFNLNKTIANNYYVIGEYQKAKEAYAKAANLIGDDASLWFSLASMEIQMRDYAAAGSHIETALTLEPGNAEFWRTKLDIVTQFQRLSPEQIQSQFDKAKTSTQDSPDILSYYAKYLEKQGDVAGAIAQWEKAAQVNPEGAAVYKTEIEELKRAK